MPARLGRRLALKLGLGLAGLASFASSAGLAAKLAVSTKPAKPIAPQAQPDRTYELANQLVAVASQALPLTESTGNGDCLNRYRYQPCRIEDQLRLAEAELGLGQAQAGRLRLDWLTDQIGADQSPWQTVKAWTRLAELRSAVGEDEAVQIALAKAIGQAEAADDQQDRQSLLIVVAEALVRMGELEQGLQIVGAIEVEPDLKDCLQTELLLVRVRSQLDLGDWEAGLATISAWPALKAWSVAEDLVQAFWSVRQPDRLLSLVAAFDSDHLKVAAGLAFGKAGQLDQAFGLIQAVKSPDLRADGALSLVEGLLESALVGPSAS